ncbi:MAG: DUF3990 domain-containing protein [Prevotella sp.]|nr:DUF3990 domain-containing protein [Prevotella sp.]MBP3827656.1 DUF3990 domain-containing protein [Prevotella sp.]MBQ7441487.1 DUF3990 domain-containing protein [Prevotella sp.]
MDKIRVYHGSTSIVKQPLCRIGRPNLDFGQGFYVTSIRQQAIDWAMNMGRKKGLKPLLNIYQLDREAILSEARCKLLTAYDREWLLFIVDARKGADIASIYDYVEGGVANDRVVDTVNLYMTGLMDLDTALQRLSQHQPNNQICLLSQRIIDKYLVYEGTAEI